MSLVKARDVCLCGRCFYPYVIRILLLDEASRIPGQFDASMITSTQLTLVALYANMV